MLYDKLEGLLEVSPNRKETKAIDALHQIAEATPRRSLVLLFSDLLDKSEDPGRLDRRLAAPAPQQARGEVVFHLIALWRKPIHVESGEELKLHPSEVRETYITHMAKLQDPPTNGAHGIDWVDVDGLVVQRFF